MKTILIVGRSFSTLHEHLKASGYDYVTLLDERLTKLRGRKFKHRVLVDFSDQAKLLEAVDNIKAEYQFHGVMALYESYVLPAAKIAEHLGLPGLPLEAARACTDKYLMRQKFALAPIKISPGFAEIKSAEDVRRFAESYAFPLIIKPANLSKSLLVSKNNTLDELLQNYERTASNVERVYAKYAPNAKPRLIIEEYLQGTVHSVDAFVDSSGTPHVLDGVVDYQTGYDIGYDDNFHYSRLMPSKLPSKVKEEIRQVAAVGCQALDMKSSPAHVEVILTQDGPRIVEIGARNGGYRDRMHHLADGEDIRGNAIKVAVGEQPIVKAVKNEPVAVLELFPKHPGYFKLLKNEKRLRSLPSTVYYSIKAQSGDYVGKSSDGYKMCAVIILHNKDSEQFQSDLDFINNHVAVLTADVSAAGQSS